LFDFFLEAEGLFMFALPLALLGAGHGVRYFMASFGMAMASSKLLLRKARGLQQEAHGCSKLKICKKSMAAAS
jgi:hypothetical protein